MQSKITQLDRYVTIKQKEIKGQRCVTKIKRQKGSGKTEGKSNVKRSFIPWGFQSAQSVNESHFFSFASIVVTVDD